MVHGKLMLLFHKDGFLRIALPTGNLRPSEWGASKASECLDNAVFMIDLLLLNAEDDAEAQSKIPFRSSLLHYVDCLGLDAGVKGRLLRYNFDQTYPYAFVYTG
jgi:hypothetical protein